MNDEGDQAPPVDEIQDNAGQPNLAQEIGVLVKNIRIEEADPKNRTTVQTIEAQKLLALPTDLPEHFYKILGRENIKRLIRALSSQDYIDVDMLTLTERTGVEAVNQYMACLPEFRSLRAEIRDTTRTFVESIIKDQRLRNYIRKSTETRDVWENSRRYNLAFVKHDSGIVELFTLIEDLAKKFSIKTRTPNVRQGVLNEMVKLFQLSLYPKALEALNGYIETEHGNKDEKWKTELRKSFDSTVTKASFVTQRTGTLEGKRLTIREHCIETLLREQSVIRPWVEANRARFSGIATSCTEDAATLERKNNEKTQEIEALSQTRRIGGKAKMATNNLLFLTTQPFKSANTPQNYSMAIIPTDLTEKFTDPRKVPAIPITLDRTDMDLHVVPGAVKLRDYFDPKTFEVIRAIFLDMILEDLESATENFDDLLVNLNEYPANEPSAQETISEIREEISATAQPIQDSESPPENTEEATSQTVRVKRKSPSTNVDFGRLKSLSGTNVYRILNRILGGPIRQHGSHHVFKGPNGRVFPVPIHFNTTVNPYILRGALEGWGIVEEFYTELG